MSVFIANEGKQRSVLCMSILLVLLLDWIVVYDGVTS